VGNNFDYTTDDMSHIELTYVTHFYFNQGNIESLKELVKVYESYPAKLLDRIHFVFVDDCSPLEFDPLITRLNATWLRINEDISWNQPGARNLGITYAKSDKIIITDLDKLIPQETFEYMLAAPKPNKTIFKMRRLEKDGTLNMRGHPNTFFLSRWRFMQLHGYDEDYSGSYGYDDQGFIKHMKDHGTRQKYLPNKLYCINRKLNLNDSYHSLERDLSGNKPVYLKKKDERALFGSGAGHSRRFLGFTWSIVSEQRRAKPEYLKKPNRLWRKLWVLRTLFRQFTC